jgi:hypothetical protein
LQAEASRTNKVKRAAKRFMRRQLTSFCKMSISNKFTEYGGEPQLGHHFEIANNELAPLQQSVEISRLQPFHKSVVSAPSGSRSRNDC